MRQLLLLRHAKSAWDNPALPDRDRPLSARGRRATALMRDAMHNLGLCPDLVLLSPARRTMETLELLEPWDETPLVEPLEQLYLATAEQIMAAAREVSDVVRSVLIIGHNPGMHDFAVGLSSETGSKADRAMRRLKEGFPTAALAEYSVPGPWSRLAPGGALLTRFLTPRELEAAH